MHLIFQMWSIEYVQVPMEKEKIEADQVDESSKAQSISNKSGLSVTLVKSDSECSLASDDDASVKENLGSDRTEGNDDNDDSLKDEDLESPTKVRMALNVDMLQQKRPSLVSAKSLHEQINHLTRKANGNSGFILLVI